MIQINQELQDIHVILKLQNLTGRIWSLRSYWQFWRFRRFSSSSSSWNCSSI